MRLMFLLAILCSAPLCAADPPKFPNWPVTPVIPSPMPSPVDPSPVTRLGAEQLYVLQDDAPFILLASPAGLVSITEESGPIRIRGKFVDGAGKTETRTYTGKQVCIIEGLVTGRVELLKVPVGAKTSKDVERRSIDVDAQNPIPPPDPPGPKPPEPKPPVPVTSFRVILVYESGDTLTAAQTSVLYGKTVEDFLNANCTGGKAGWRRRDKDASSVNDPPMSVVWAAVKGEFAPPKNTKVPAVVIQVNEKITIEPLAATPAEMVATLKRYSEGK